MSQTSRLGAGAWHAQEPLKPITRTHRANGRGNECSRRRDSTWTRQPANVGAITCTSPFIERDTRLTLAGIFRYVVPRIAFDPSPSALRV